MEEMSKIEAEIIGAVAKQDTFQHSKQTQIVGRSDIGAGRVKNQDAASYAVSDKQMILCVADGLGSYLYSERAAHLAVKELAEQWITDINIQVSCLSLHRKLREMYPYIPSIKSAFKKKKKILKAVGEEDDGATTFVGVQIHNDTCTIANIGDSRCYIFRNDEIIYKSHDQSYLHYLQVLGEMEKTPPKGHPMAGVLLNALGAPDAEYTYYWEGKDQRFRTGEPLIAQEKLNAGDKVLLCTDGLYSNMSDESLIRFSQHDVASFDREIHQTVKRIFSDRKRLDGQPATLDNYTYIFYQHS